MSTRIHVLGLRFAQALTQAGTTASSEARSAVFTRLVARYREPHRRYHTLAHVAACLSAFDGISDSAERPEEVELALWFHDAIYDPHRWDNEQCSALLAEEELARVGVAAATRARISESIEATARHCIEEGDSALVIDLDLTILGVCREGFDRFEAQVREEYAHVPDAAYATARARVLQDFLTRPRIFHVPAIHEALEQIARSNLRRRLSALLSETSSRR